MVTSLYFLHEGKRMTAHYMLTELADKVLRGEVVVEPNDDTVIEVFMKYVLVNYNFHNDTTLPDEGLKEMGFEPYNEERH